MRKLLFSKVVLSLGLLTAAVGTDAQVAPPLSSGNIRGNIMNARFKVNTPAAISGLKKITLATWGAQVTTVLSNIPVARGLDSLAANPLTNPTAVAGKFALLYRGGGITFRQKADYAFNAGAIGVIIVNNIPGDPVAMGNTGTGNVLIPVVMVSDVEGNAINNQLRNSVPVTITLGAWNLGATHDLGLVDGYQSLPHALNIPLHQFSNSMNKIPYRNWLGGAIANFGTATETNITVADSLTFTPTGGSAAYLSQHSYNIASIAPLDSIRFGFGTVASSYYITPPTSTGRYDYRYHISYGQTDEIPQDNSYTISQYINDSIFCKGNFDYVKGQPRVSQGIQPSGGSTPFIMGPMFYVTNGGYAARKLQFYLSKNGTDVLDGSEVFALVYKWVDGSNGEALDSFVVGGELTNVGQTYYRFNAADSSGRFYSLGIDNPLVPNAPVVLDSNSWYWVCIQSPSDCFIGVDESVNYFTRSYVQSQLVKYQDYPEGAFFSDINTLTANNLVFNFPFGGNADNIDSTFYDRYNQIPAIALHMSKNKVGTGVSQVVPTIGKLSLFPNPASNVVNVDVDLVQQSDKLGLRLLDVMGRIVYTEDFTKVKKNQFSINTSKLAAGTYHLFVTTDGGYLTKEVVVAR